MSAIVTFETQKGSSYTLVLDEGESGVLFRSSNHEVWGASEGRNTWRVGSWELRLSGDVFTAPELRTPRAVFFTDEGPLITSPVTKVRSGLLEDVQLDAIELPYVG